MNDGTAITYIGGLQCSGSAVAARIEFDLNGEKGPNRAGRDRFTFCVNRQNEMEKYKNLKLISAPLSETSLKNLGNLSRQDLLTDCKNYNYYCTALIMYDGWEIKSDYPYKL